MVIRSTSAAEQQPQTNIFPSNPFKGKYTDSGVDIIRNYSLEYDCTAVIFILVDIGIL
ncbi:MAG TPA: hypothetical protein VD694_06770 [Nitrososphaeraceae archaeon]|nr:hypothetical protein [Nitrososphaeraceae archaeon]